MPRDENLQPGTYSLEQTARRLGIGTATVYRLAARNKLPVPVYYIGAQKRTLVADVEAWLAGGRGLLKEAGDDAEEEEPEAVPVRRRRVS